MFRITWPASEQYFINCRRRLKAGIDKPPPFYVSPIFVLSPMVDGTYSTSVRWDSSAENSTVDTLDKNVSSMWGGGGKEELFLEVSVLLGRDATSLRDWKPTFRDSVMFLSKNIFLGTATLAQEEISGTRTALFWVITQRVMVISCRRFWTLKDGPDRLPRNVGNKLPLLAA